MRLSFELMASFESHTTVLAPGGDAKSFARRRLIEGYLPLVRSIAGRFVGRGERYEDLVQVGTIGLIRAVDRCDPERTSELTAYASRCVEGEIRHHLRDRCTVVRIPRRVMQDDVKPAAARTPLPLDGEADEVMLFERLDEIGSARAMVAWAAQSLDGRERLVVGLRYFCDLSQAEIGDRVGVSQVHVSRLLHDAIEKMRVRLEPDDAPCVP